MATGHLPILIDSTLKGNLAKILVAGSVAIMNPSSSFEAPKSVM
jgi:hypothetical protein